MAKTIAKKPTPKTSSGRKKLKGDIHERSWHKKKTELLPPSSDEDEDWCTCGNCPQDEPVEKRSCCGAHNPETCLATVYGDDIEELLQLQDSDIEEFPKHFKVHRPASIAVMQPRSKRILGYAKLFRLLQGYGKTRVKVPTPSCCRAPIAEAFPG